MKISQRAVLGFALAMLIGFSTPVWAAKGAKGGGPIEKIREATAQLDLTAEQQPKVDKILDDAQQEVAKLRQAAKASGDRAAVKEKAKEVIKDTIGKLSHVLTPEQRGKLRELIKEARAEKKGENSPATQPAGT
jgi:Spy/CpxP family protein refolding chaperone